MKAEKSFNNPSTLTVNAKVRRDHDRVIITIRHDASARFQNLFLSKLEAKILGLELYKMSDGGDIEAENLAEQLVDNPRFLKDMGLAE